MTQFSRLLNLQIFIEEQNLSANDPERLLFSESANQVHIDFYGDSEGISFIKLLDVLCDTEIASVLKTLTVRGKETGSNGTRLWNISRIAESSIGFPVLESISFELYNGLGPNRPVIGDNRLIEQGMIGKLLIKSPHIKSLILPSAPGDNFFQLRKHLLEKLIIQAGYDHQDFILNLSQSTCFPHLHYLDFTDYDESYIEGYLKRRTPYLDFKNLFQSLAFSSVATFVVRQTSLSKAQLRELKSIRPTLRLLTISTSVNYLR